MAANSQHEVAYDNVLMPVGKPSLLLHCCCAPCAGYVLERLLPHYGITILFYNPNIQPREEYDRRAAEFNKLTAFWESSGSVGFVLCDYNADCFEAVAEPFFDEAEGGRRCRACFELRIAETVKRAIEGGFDFCTTTLSVSPHKNALLLNEIGDRLAGEMGARFLSADFKKRDGYKRSVELSKHLGLYRQTYCGCAASNK